jgi:alpha-L-rhamnosidase
MIPRSLLIFAALIFAGPLAAQTDSPVRLGALTCEHQTNPVGIGDTQPRLSWKLLSDRVGEVQTAYEIRAASTAAALAAGQADLWGSGKVASDQSVLVPWGGTALTSRAQVFWQVRVWDKDGVPSAWSDPATFELGLIKPATDWKGQWITVDLPRFDIEAAPLAKANWINAGATANQATGIRLAFDLPADAKILGATVDVSADGIIAIYANGKPTRQGSTSHTAPFHADFGQNLTPGHNLLAIGSGAVRNYRGTDGRNAIAAHVVIDLENGQHIEFNTDGSWKAGIPPSPAGRGGFGGPAVAPAAPVAGANWYTPDFDDSAWAAATVIGPYADSKVIASADSTIGPGRYLRKTFTVKGPVAKARLYSTALGTYEASIDGQRVNDHQLDPGFTSYDKRVMVQTTDVAALLKPGQNALGVVLNDGWFVGRLGWMGLYQYKQVSDHPSFNAQLEITYADGTTDVIATDATWKGGPGEVVGSDEQLGQVIDANQAAPFDRADFNDTAWANATVEDHSAVALDPQRGPPVRELMELTPKKITKQGNLWLVDFGQNMVGHVRLTVNGTAGSVIKVSHGEMLNTDGTLYNENLRTAISLDTFVLKGGSQPETFEPQFTFHGFRYALVEGYPGELTADNIRGIVVGSDNSATGTWESSNAGLNQLFSNILWSQRGNFLSIPTDCPQRDERLGWMGDAQIFAPTAALDADVASFFNKWMVDVDDSQSAAGGFTAVSPVANQNNSYAIWGDAGVIVPWVMYQTYGDKKFLSDNYTAMARWITYQYNHYPTLLVSGGVGDNLAPPMAGVGPGAAASSGTATGAAAAGADPGARGAAGARGGAGGFGGGARAGLSVYDTAYNTNSIRIVAKAAAALGRTDDAAGYEKLYQAAVQAFDTAYLSPDGTITSDTQTAYVLALQFDLVPDNLRAAVAQKFLDNIARYDHLSTGFVGCAWLCPALTKIGHSDVAWKLLFTDTYPSWLFEIKNGATTIWEHWDGWTPERGFQGSSENSFNHYSEGEVGYWFYSDAAGIKLDDASPGYKHFILAPQFTDQLAYVKSSYDSPYGKISSYWHVEGDQMDYDVTVPPNSSATLQLPVPAKNVLESGAPVKSDTDTSTTMALAAGTYHFTFPKAGMQ